MISQIACFGAAHVDIKAFSQSRVMFGAKNPVTTIRSLGGVARNIAENLSRIGIPVSLFSRVGADELGEGVLKAVRDLGIESSQISTSLKSPTASYTALLEPDGTLAVALSDMAIYDEIVCDEATLALYRNCKIWLIDANLPVEAMQQIARYCPEKVELWAIGVSVAKNQRFISIVDRLDLLIINEQEYLELVTIKKPQRVLMTQGRQGAVLFSDDGLMQFSAMLGNLVDVTGAGDGFSAGLAYGYLREKSLNKAIPYAMSVAKMTVETSDSVSQSIDAKVLNDHAQKYSNKLEHLSP